MARTEIKLETQGKIKFEDFYRLCVNSVKGYGVNLMPNNNWTSSNAETVAKIYFIYNIMWFINGTLLMLSLCCKAVAEWKNGGLTSTGFLGSLIAVITGISNSYKGYLMTRYQNKIKNILKELKDLFPTSAADHEQFEIKKTLRTLLRMKWTYFCLYAVMIFGVSIPNWIQFFTGVRIHEQFWTPYELDTTLRFVLTYTWLAWMSFCFCFGGFGADFVLYSSITMLSIQFKVGMKNFRANKIIF